MRSSVRGTPSPSTTPLEFFIFFEKDVKLHFKGLNFDFSSEVLSVLEIKTEVRNKLSNSEMSTVMMLLFAHGERTKGKRQED